MRKMLLCFTTNPRGKNDAKVVKISEILRRIENTIIWNGEDETKL